MSTAPRVSREGAQPARRILLPRSPRGGPRFNLFQDVYGELKKVVWPTRDQVVNLSVIVIVASLAVGVALGFIDWLFSQLIEMFLKTG